MTDAWIPTEFPADGRLLARVGPMALHLRRRGDELHAGVTYPEGGWPSRASLETPSPDATAPDEWLRWVIGETAASVHLLPILPDRPVVVLPEQPVRFPPGRQADFFVRVPLTVRITIPSDRPLMLGEHPTVVLSNTWFGDPIVGELCYSMQTTARRTAEESTVAPNRAVCPLTIRNESDEDLEVERLCVQVQHLRVYRGESVLWTNRARAIFHGPDRTSRLEYETVAPPQARDGEKLSEERSPAPNGLFRRTFASLRGMRWRQ